MEAKDRSKLYALLAPEWKRCSMEGDLTHPVRSSLDAMRLATTIEARLGLVVPPHIILSCSSYAELEDRIIRMMGGGVRCDLNGDGGDFQDVVVLIPGAGGESEVFRDLIDGLSKHAIVHLVYDAKGGLRQPDATFGRLVDGIAEELMRFKSQRVHLVGWCTGGLIAHAVACRLADRKMDVASLSIIESNGPRTQTDAQSPRRGARLTLALSKIKRHGIGELLRRRFKRACKSFRLSWTGLCKRIKLPAAEHLRLEWNQYCDLKMLQHSHLSKYSGDITLLWSTADPDWEWLREKSEGRFFRIEEAQERWSRVTSGEVLTKSIPGDHISIFMPPGVHMMVDILGQNLKGKTLLKNTDYEEQNPRSDYSKDGSCLSGKVNGGA